MLLKWILGAFCAVVRHFVRFRFRFCVRWLVYIRLFAVFRQLRHIRLYKYHDAYKINFRGIILACGAFPRLMFPDPLRVFCIRSDDGLHVCRVHPVPRVLHLVPDLLQVRRVFRFRSRLLSSGRACGTISAAVSADEHLFGLHISGPEMGSCLSRTFVRFAVTIHLPLANICSEHLFGLSVLTNICSGNHWFGVIEHLFGSTIGSDSKSPTIGWHRLWYRFSGSTISSGSVRLRFGGSLIMTHIRACEMVPENHHSLIMTHRYAHDTYITYHYYIVTIIHIRATLLLNRNVS